MEAIAMNSKLASFISAILGLSIFCSVFFNLRVLWIGVKNFRSNDGSLQLSPFLLSSCCAETTLTCVYGPMMCVLLTNKNLSYDSNLSAFLDITFLALFWCIVVSYLLYTLDRHCLIVARNVYPEAFGRLRRNIITLIFIWTIVFSLALVYLKIRPGVDQNSPPMTFLFTGSMLYCFIAVILLYVIPSSIIIGCLLKIFVKIRKKEAPMHLLRKNIGNEEMKTSGLLTRDIQACVGLSFSSVLFILSSLPWVMYQFLKALKLNSSATIEHEIILLSILVTGVGFKTASFVLSFARLRHKFFSNLLCSNTRQFALEQPSVITNMSAI